MVLRGRFAVLLALLLIDAATGAARKKRSAGAGVAREGAATAAGLSAAERFKLATQHQIAGVQLANAGRVGEAVGELDACASLLDGLEEGRTLRAQVVAMIGNAHTLLGDIAKGVSFWLKAIKIDPLIVDARQNVIKSLVDQGKFADALKHARKAAKLHPANTEFLVAVGDSCKALRDFTCAKDHYRRALQLDPAHFVATFALAVAHRDLMDLAAAIPLFERAGELDPANTAVVNALAVVRGDTCVWGSPDFSDPDHTAAQGNRFLATAAQGLPRRQSPIHPLLLAYYSDDAALLRRVAASHARQALREAAVYIGHAAIDRATNEPDLDAAVGDYFTYNFTLFTTASVPRAQRGRPRLRVGYLTADVHDHPTALLIHGMFGPQTDSGRIQVYLYSYGPDDGSLYRAAIARECEHIYT